MVGPIESVTVAVTELERQRQFFQERFGLAMMSDGYASVGLLSAWRYPVHESVRLTELAYGTQPHGRVRLALFEDAAGDLAAARDSTADSWDQAGPCALDFRSDATARDGTAMQTSGLPLLLTDPSGPRGALRSVWILCADAALSSRFYVEALGYRLEEETETKVGEGRSCVDALRLPPGMRLRLARLSSGKATVGGVVLIAPLDRETQARPRALGGHGINLLTARCEDLDDLIERIAPLGLEPLSAPSHVSLPNGCPARVMVVQGPGSEVFEFTEIHD